MPGNNLFTSSDCFMRAPISRLSGFPKCGRATDIVYSIADASRLKKQNFMSDKKRTTFFHCFFVLVLKRAVLSIEKKEKKKKNAHSDCSITDNP
jgi:hypothetical protein